MHTKEASALSLTWLSFSATEWRQLPDRPGVYRFYDKKGKLLYVGKAKVLAKRVGSYFQQNRILSGKTRRMVAQISYIMHTEVQSEHDALLLENNLIKAQQPKYNILLRDDKSYPYLCIRQEPFSRLLPVRQRKKGEGQYIGPYTNGRAMRYLLHTVRHLCKLRTCNYDLSKKYIQQRKYKVCLEYHIGNCRGPCEGLQTEAEYEREVAQAASILKGKMNTVREYLREELRAATAALRFEEAQKLKEKLSALEQLQSRSVVANPTIDDLDVCTVVEKNERLHINYMQIVEGRVVLSDTAVLKLLIEEKVEDLLPLLLMQLREKYDSHSQEVLVNLPVLSWEKDLRLYFPKKGDKKRLVDMSLQNAQNKGQELRKRTTRRRSEKILRQVQRELRLQVPPQHIECFDISNLQGSQTVGAMVCFQNGRPAKAQYRQYHIQSLPKGKVDDYAAMREVVERRYKRLLKEEAPLPDLIIIDGGKGQLSIAAEVLTTLQLRTPLIGLAKRHEEVFLPGAAQPLPLRRDGDTCQLIQQIRNEAHRTAVSFHRQTRSKQALQTTLMEIPGVGESTCMKLLKTFDSLEKIASASYEQLATCIGKKRAKTLQKGATRKKLPLQLSIKPRQNLLLTLR